MNTYDLYIFDLDGVLYRGSEPIPGAAKAVENLRKANKSISFLTNNSSKSRKEYVNKLNQLGFIAYENEVFSSAYGAAKFLKNSNAKTFHALGESGLVEEINSAGLIESDSPDWVAVGICWDLTYQKLDKAQSKIRSGAKFLATNTDATFPDEGGKIRPGAGSIVAAISTCVGRNPDFVIGKPNPFLLNCIFEETKVEKSSAILIGDRVDTDILAAKNFGIPSALVLTGVATPQEAMQADFCLQSVAEITP